MIPFLVYIAIGILFMFWVNGLISVDPDLRRPGERDAVRLIAVLFWLPVLLVFIYARIKESKNAD